MLELCEVPSNIKIVSRFPHKAWVASSSIHDFHACRSISRRNMLDILKIQRLKMQCRVSGNAGNIGERLEELWFCLCSGG